MAITTNYNDERLTQVQSEKNAAVKDLENQYNQMINESDKFYDEQIQASKDWASEQQQIQQEQTDFAIEQVEQQREKTEKDYIKEQSGAYVDYQKQSGKYGVQAEQQAASGLQGTGFSESSQVSMFNQYQNRVSSARESLNQANMNFDNAIQQARLQNNAKQAEIALEAYQKQLELALQGFQYRNDLISVKLDKVQALDDTYHNRYQDVLDQINTENAMNEEIRQFEENLKMQQAQLAEQIRQFDAEMARLKAEDERAHALEIQQMEMQKQELALKQQQLAEEQRQFNASLEASKNNQNNTSKNAVNTEFYSGSLNKDANTYGTFSNGYQPKGISGYGEVRKTGESIDVTIKNLSGKTITKTQNVWKTPDGTLWYWDGSQNKYVKISQSNSSSGGRYFKMTK